MKALVIDRYGGKLVSIVQATDDEIDEKYGVEARIHWLRPNGEQLGKA